MANRLRKIERIVIQQPDETDLYYVVLVSASDESRPLVTVEDCGTLELFVCPLPELEQRRFRAWYVSPMTAEALVARARNCGEKEERR